MAFDFRHFNAGLPDNWMFRVRRPKVATTSEAEVGSGVEMVVEAGVGADAEAGVGIVPMVVAEAARGYAQGSNIPPTTNLKLQRGDYSNWAIRNECNLTIPYSGVSTFSLQFHAESPSITTAEISNSNF